MKSTQRLREQHPQLPTPMYCDNGCGAVIDVTEAYISYKRNERGDRLLICECCAAEEGHLHEAHEEPDAAPICHRQPKRKLR